MSPPCERCLYRYTGDYLDGRITLSDLQRLEDSANEARRQTFRPYRGSSVSARSGYEDAIKPVKPPVARQERAG